MFWAKMSLFMIKFICDKSNVTTLLIVLCYVFNEGKLGKKVLNVLKHQIFWNIKHQKKKTEGVPFVYYEGEKNTRRGG